MDEEILLKLHTSGLEYFDLPDFETFKVDMQDKEKLTKFRESMSQYYDMPDIDTFKTDTKFTENIITEPTVKKDVGVVDMKNKPTTVTSPISVMTEKSKEIDQSNIRGSLFGDDFKLPTSEDRIKESVKRQDEKVDKIVNDLLEEGTEEMVKEKVWTDIKNLPIETINILTDLSKTEEEPITFDLSKVISYPQIDFPTQSAAAAATPEGFEGREYYDQFKEKDEELLPKPVQVEQVEDASKPMQKHTKITNLLNNVNDQIGDLLQFDPIGNADKINELKSQATSLENLQKITNESISSFTNITQRILEEDMSSDEATAITDLLINTDATLYEGLSIRPEANQYLLNTKFSKTLTDYNEFLEWNESLGMLNANGSQINEMANKLNIPYEEMLKWVEEYSTLMRKKMNAEDARDLVLDHNAVWLGELGMIARDMNMSKFPKDAFELSELDKVKEKQYNIFAGMNEALELENVPMVVDNLYQNGFFDGEMFLGKTEEEIAPLLNDAFNRLGINTYATSEEGRVGNNITISSKNGPNLVLHVNESYKTNAANRAIELYEYIKKYGEFQSTQSLRNLKSNRQVSDFGIHMRSEKFLEYQAAELNANANYSLKEDKNLNNEFEKLSTELTNEYTQAQQQLQNFIINEADIVNGYVDPAIIKAKEAELFNPIIEKEKKYQEYFNLKKEALTLNTNDLKLQKTNYDNAVQASFIMESRKGTFTSATVNSLLTGAERLVLGGGKLANDLITYVNPLQYISAWSQGKDASDEIDKKLKDFNKSYIEANRGFLTDIGPKPLEQYLQASHEDLLYGSWLGLMESAPAMVLSAVTGGGASGIAAFSLQQVDYLNEEMNNNSYFDNISEAEKWTFIAPLAVATGVLEEIGFAKGILNKGSSNVLNTLTFNVLKKLPKNSTLSAFKELMNIEFKNSVAKGLIRITKAGGLEYETGALQAITEVGLKEFYEWSKQDGKVHKQIFETAADQGAEAFFEEIKHQALSEMLGGFYAATPMAVANGMAENRLGKTSTDNQFKFLEFATRSKSNMSLIEAGLKQDLANGKITSQQYNELLQKVKVSGSIFREIPNNADLQDRKQAYDLITEKRKLQDEINIAKEQQNGASVESQIARVKKIDEQLKQISTYASNSGKKQRVNTPVLNNAKNTNLLSKEETTLIDNIQKLYTTTNKYVATSGKDIRGLDVMQDAVTQLTEISNNLKQSGSSVKENIAYDIDKLINFISNKASGTQNYISVDLNKEIKSGKTQQDIEDLYKAYRSVDGYLGQTVYFVNNKPISAREFENLMQDKDFVEELKNGESNYIILGPSINDMNNHTGEEFGIKDIAETQQTKVTEKLEEAVKEAEETGIPMQALETTSDFVKAVDKAGVKNEDGSAITEEEAKTTDALISKEGKIFINKEVAKQTGNVSAPLHEVIHRLINTEITDPTKQAEVVKKFKEELAKDKKAYDIVEKRLQKAYIDTGILTKKEATTSDEWVTLFFDAVATNKIKPKENVVTKIGNWIVENILRPVGFYKIKFESGKDVFRFAKSYGKQVKAGKVKKATKKFVKETVAKPSMGTTTKLSKAETPLQAINNLIPDVIKTKEQYDDFIRNERTAKPIIDALNKPGGVINNYIRSRQETQVEGNKMIEESLFRLFNFNPEAKRKDGTVVGKEGFGEAIFANTRFAKLVARKKLFEEGEKKKRTISIDAEQVKQIATTTEITTREKPVRKGIVLADRLQGKAKTAVEKIESKVNTKALTGAKEIGPITKEEQIEYLEKQTYKSLKDLVSGETQKMFGIKPKPGNLTKQDVKNAQIFIANNPDLFYALLPKQHTTKTVNIGTKADPEYIVRPDKATGIQNVLLEAFYNKGTRKDNLTPWTKKPASDIKTSEFLDLFGITEKGDPNLYKKSTNISARIKALVEQTGRLITNQTVRQAVPEATKVGEGRSKVMFSKSEIKKEAKNLLEDLDTELTPEQVTNQIEEVLEFSLKYGANSAMWDIMTAALDPHVVEVMEEIGLKENFNKEATAYKTPMLNWNYPSIFEYISSAYKQNNTNRDNEIAMKQMLAFSNELAKSLDPRVANILGIDFFGFINRYLDPAKEKRDTKQPAKYYEDSLKIKEYFKKTTKEKLNFNPENIRIFNSGFGIMNEIETILGKDITANEKWKQLGKNKDGSIKKGSLLNEVQNANIANKAAMKYIYNKVAKVIGKNPKLGIGFVRWGESTTNTTKGQRGLTSLDLIEVLDGSQAVYYNPKTETYKNNINGLKNKEDFVINKNHPNYKKAYDLVQKEFKQNKQLTLLNKIDPLKYKEKFNKSLIKALSFKGEHITPSANTMKSLVKETLTTASTIYQTPDIEISHVNLKLNEIINNSSQSLGTELFSAIQDKKLGKTSVLNNLRALAINKNLRDNFFTLEGGKATDYIIKLEIFDKVVQALGKDQRKAADLNSQSLNKSGVVKMSKSLPNSEILREAGIMDKALNIARDPNAPVKKIRVFDFDDTLAQTKSKVFYTMPDGKEGSLTAEQFADRGTELKEQGAEFDFSDFDKVVKGRKGPLFEVAQTIAAKRGTEDLFVLTARGPNAAIAIKEFLDGIGLDIPLENITGLGDSSPLAKSGWIVNKAAEGYNDFYFADDHVANVEAVQRAIDALPVKGKTQQAKVKFSMETKRDLKWDTTNRVAETSFKIKDKTYNIRLSEETKGVYELDFGLRSEKVEGSLGKVGITGTGNASEILSIISNGVLDFVKTNKVKEIVFSAIEPSRSRLYSTLTKFWANKLGWGHEADVMLDGSGFFKIGKNVQTTESFDNQSKPERKVLNVIDTKSKVQRSKVKFSKTVDQTFNDIIEQKTGIEAFKEYSAARAQTIGAKKGKFKFLIPPSAEDFVGLLYPMLGKGKIGDAQMAFFKEKLLNPFARGMESLSNDRVRLMNDFNTLKKELVKFGAIPKNLKKKAIDNFTQEDIVRVIAWDQQGIEVEGLSKRDLAEFKKFVENNPGLQMFIDELISINKGDGYAYPGKNWLAGTITTDLIEGLNTTKRFKYLQEWQANVDLIFSEKNLNKLEVAFGTKYREALEDALRRMKSGKNRKSTGGRLENRILDYINNSIGTVMFLNMRSGVLQTISAINFMNWSFNNPLRAGKALANQKQYWSDFMKLMNSDFLVDRRNGLRINVSESEIADAARGQANKPRAVINYLLKKGFLVTQIMDSFAIASGGSTFYRNKIKDLMKKDPEMKLEEAEKIAFKEFREIAEESQQSSRPDRISQQQASGAGRVVLAFANTPMQYNRIIKKATLDLINGRGDYKTNLSKIVYYSMVQNFIFSALQQAIFAIGFDEEEEEANKEKYYKIGNSMVDNLLRGLGIGGQVVMTSKNLVQDVYKRYQKSIDPDATWFEKQPRYEDSAWKVLDFSPPLSIKLRKLVQAAKNWEYNEWRHDADPWSLEDPAYLSIAYVVSSITNVPLDRLVKKMTNARGAMEADQEWWKRVAMLSGWQEWELESSGERTERKEKEKATKRDIKAKADPGVYTKEEQIDILRQYNIRESSINKLKTEKDRVDAILDLRKETKKIYKPKIKPPSREYKDLKSKTKAEQIKILQNLNIRKSSIDKLKNEDDRIEAIIDIRNEN